MVRTICTEANENVRYALFLLSCPIHQFLVTLEYGGERVVKLSKSLNWSACTQAQPEKDVLNIDFVKQTYT